MVETRIGDLPFVECFLCILSSFPDGEIRKDSVGSSSPIDPKFNAKWTW
jgi:hypothetical protein